jgi:radical SAM superfamily enzyme
METSLSNALLANKLILSHYYYIKSMGKPIAVWSQSISGVSEDNPLEREREKTFNKKLKFTFVFFTSTYAFIQKLEHVYSQAQN